MRNPRRTRDPCRECRLACALGSQGHRLLPSTSSCKSSAHNLPSPPTVRQSRARGVRVYGQTNRIRPVGRTTDVLVLQVIELECAGRTVLAQPEPGKTGSRLRSAETPASRSTFPRSRSAAARDRAKRAWATRVALQPGSAAAPMDDGAIEVNGLGWPAAPAQECCASVLEPKDRFNILPLSKRCWAGKGRQYENCDWNDRAFHMVTLAGLRYFVARRPASTAARGAVDAGRR